MSQGLMTRKPKRLELTEEQRQEIQEVFNMFDTDKDDKLDYYEFKVAMKALGFDLPKGEIMGLIRTHDRTGDNRLGYGAFFDIMSEKIRNRDPVEEIRKAFKLFDDKSKGRITMGDLKRVSEELGETMAEDELQAMIDEFDLDGDGAINSATVAIKRLPVLQTVNGINMDNDHYTRANYLARRLPPEPVAPVYQGDPPIQPWAQAATLSRGGVGRRRLSNTDRRGGNRQMVVVGGVDGYHHLGLENHGVQTPPPGPAPLEARRVYSGHSTLGGSGHHPHPTTGDLVDMHQHSATSTGPSVPPFHNNSPHGSPRAQRVASTDRYQSTGPQGQPAYYQHHGPGHHSNPPSAHPTPRTLPPLSSSAHTPGQHLPPAHPPQLATGPTSLRRSTEYPGHPRIVATDQHLPHLTEPQPVRDILAQHVFVQYQHRVKKARLPNPLTSIPSFTEWLVEYYHSTLDVAKDTLAQPIVYIRLSHTDTFYELDDLAEVLPGCTVKLQSADERKSEKNDTITSTSPSEALIDSVTQIQALTTHTTQMLDHILAIESAQDKHHHALVEKLVKLQAAPSPVSTPNPSSAARGFWPGTARRGHGDLLPLENELQKTKQQLSVLRQTYNAHRRSTEDLLQQVRQEYGVMKEKLGTKSSSLRAIIENGKARLAKATDSTAVRNDEVRMLLGTIRQDITQRGARPSPEIMKFIERECGAVKSELEMQLAFVTEVKPVWKSAWEEELNNIMVEELFVKDQQAMLEDLEKENEALTRTYQQIKQYAQIQESTNISLHGEGRVPRVINVAPIEAGNMIIRDVFQEISCIDVNSSKRLEALERSQKLRQKELENKTNAFEDELAEFVATQKLRKTGGTEELERQREKKDREVLRMMNETQQQLAEYQQQQRLLRQQQMEERKRRLQEKSEALLNDVDEASNPADPNSPTG
ncbi:Calcium-binding component of the spindle pole body (SPB) half-bridge [Dispira simplex]|nr:Calcium-binding component of the spindle pole body (SPB) half-bridge [Dispira simplex]